MNGILHSAGINSDSFILKKSPQDLQAVLAPKVTGTFNLDAATQTAALDFFVLFSSSTGVTGNPGQADYATANAFMDAYAHYRNTLVARQQRRGHTLAIDWPLWRDGGMGVDEVTQTLIEANTGMVAMQTANGIGAFRRGLNAAAAQVMVIEGYPQKIQSWLTVGGFIAGSSDKAATTTQAPSLQDKTLQRLKVLFGATVKLDVARIDVEDPWEAYGLDSVMIGQLNQKLSAVFGDIPKTLFYEYPDLNAFAHYLSDNHPQDCLDWTALGAEDAHPIEAEPEPGREPALPPGVIQPDSTAQTEPIAIIGISSRYPQAESLQAYWDNLLAGRESITEVPAERWPLEGFFHTDRQQAAGLGKSYSKWGGFLTGIADFDSGFFNIAPAEAAGIDPQERLFLQEACKALEDAGYSRSNMPAELRQRTGVFAGVTKQEFNAYAVEQAGRIGTTHFAALVNRVSYHLDLHGPSMPVDAMCSSALAAIHEACEYLRRGRGQMAIAGAVNLYSHPLSYINLARGQLLSASRHSAAFATGGDGFVPGEGVGAIVLKPYSLALRDGDGIYALIQGTAVTHAGRTSAYRVPNPNQQAAAIQQALAQTRLDPRSIGYIESAVNGSEMGDAIETAALSKVFAGRDGVQGDRKIGSVKPNIGHAEAAAGMAQLSKVIVCLQHRTLVPTLLKGPLNPNIQFGQLPFQLQTETCAWPRLRVDGVEMPRRAGITGSGAGGINACVIVEEYIPATPEPSAADAAGPFLFVLSAHSRAHLQNAVTQWIDFLTRQPQIDLARLTYTLQVGREAMRLRLALVCDRPAALLDQLKRCRHQPQHSSGCYFGDVKAEGGDVKAERIKRSQAVEQGINNRDWATLAQLWVQGNTIPWQALYSRQRILRMNGLPTYPFARIRHWPTDTAGNAPETAEDYQAPRTGVEEKLCRIWQQILKLPKVGIKDNFFNLGVQSLLATQLISQIRRDFNIDIPLEVFFERPNIEALGEFIDTHGNRESLDIIPPADRERPWGYGPTARWGGYGPTARRGGTLAAAADSIRRLCALAAAAGFERASRLLAKRFGQL